MRLRLIAATLGMLLLGATAWADSITVQVLDAQFSTVLTTHAPERGDLSAQQIGSATPIDNFLQGNGSGETFAAGTADLFGVVARTSGLFEYTMGEDGGTSATAFASSIVTFMPLVSETSTLTVDLIGSGQYFFSDGLIRLIDLTMNTALFEYFWGWRFNFGTLVDLPREPTEQLVTGTRSFDQAWTAGHEYRLVMQVDTGADTDSQGMVMRVNGLAAVPEPSAIVLTLIGTVALATRRWRPA